MALGHSPQTVTNGLVFYYDMGNPQKSWKGAPTTNLVSDPSFQTSNISGASSGTFGSWTFGSWDTSNSHNLIDITISGINKKVLRVVRGTGSSHYFGSNWGTQTISSSTYTWSAKIRGTSGKTFIFNSQWGQIGSIILSETFTRYSFTFTKTGAGITYPYFSADSLSVGDYVDVTDVQIEQNAFATPFVDGTRSTTQAILDLTGKNTITATSPTYNSNGTFSFSGGTERLDISNTIGPIANNFSISAWVNSTDITATQNIVSMNGPYFMRISGSKVRFNVLAGGTWLFQNGTTTLSSNTWYYFTMVYNFSSSLWIGYINGVQEFSVSKTGTVSNTSFFGYVGYTPQGGEQSNFLGQIAAVQYYNRALSAAEVQQNFNALRGRYGL